MRQGTDDGMTDGYGYGYRYDIDPIVVRTLVLFVPSLFLLVHY